MTPATATASGSHGARALWQPASRGQQRRNILPSRTIRPATPGGLRWLEVPQNCEMNVKNSVEEVPDFGLQKQKKRRREQERARRSAVALGCMGHIAQKKEEEGKKGGRRGAATLALFWWLGTNGRRGTAGKCTMKRRRKGGTAALTVFGEQVQTEKREKQECTRKDGMETEKWRHEGGRGG